MDGWEIDARSVTLITPFMFATAHIPTVVGVAFEIFSCPAGGAVAAGGPISRAAARGGQSSTIGSRARRNR